jgi:putative phosphoribosyl transferase
VPAAIDDAHGARLRSVLSLLFAVRDAVSDLELLELEPADDAVLVKVDLSSIRGADESVVLIEHHDHALHLLLGVPLHALALLLRELLHPPLRDLKRVSDDRLNVFMEKAAASLSGHHHFVAGRDGQIDANSVLASVLLVLVRALDGDAAAVDVVADALQLLRQIADQPVDRLALRNISEGDLNGDLHGQTPEQATDQDDGMVMTPIQARSMRRRASTLHGPRREVPPWPIGPAQDMQVRSVMRRAYSNRTEAGEYLATKLMHYVDRRDVVVLALPRGGVPVAFEVAKALKAPLDLLLVRKLGVPGFEELAMGAIAAGGALVLNHSVIAGFGIPDSVVREVVESEELELQRRDRAYRGGRPPPNVRDEIAILVDDGLATGSTMKAAVGTLRQQRPSRIVIAVPTAARETCEAFRAEADEVVCAMTPEPFRAVGLSYEDFSQTSDDEVRSYLSRSRAWSRDEEPRLQV